jgi:hypothetical protein
MQIVVKVTSLELFKIEYHNSHSNLLHDL